MDGVGDIVGSFMSPFIQGLFSMATTDSTNAANAAATHETNQYNYEIARISIKLPNSSLG